MIHRQRNIKGPVRHPVQVHDTFRVCGTVFEVSQMAFQGQGNLGHAGRTGFRVFGRSKGSHTRAVDPHDPNTFAAHIIRRIEIGSRPSGRRTGNRINNKTAAFGHGEIISVVEPTPVQHCIALPHRTVRLFRGFYDIDRKYGTDTIRRLV